MIGIKKQILDTRRHLDNIVDQAGVHKGHRHTGKHKDDTSVLCLAGCNRK